MNPSVNFVENKMEMWMQRQQKLMQRQTAEEVNDAEDSIGDTEGNLSEEHRAMLNN